MSSNENNNEMPFGAGPESENDQDFFSTLTSDTEGAANPFGDLGTSEESSDSPFGGFDESAPLDGGFGSSFGSPEPTMDTPMVEQNAPVEDPLADASTGKKRKRPKPAKAPKIKKVKERRVIPENVPWVLGDFLLILIAVIMFGLILTVNVFAFLWYAMESVPFIVSFSILGIFLLLIPFLLWRKRVYGDRINIFDSFLALSLALAIIGCMIILSIQSIKYGTNIKGALSLDRPALNFQMESQEGLYI